MPQYRLDLHIHTPASNCFYDLENSYSGIITSANKNKIKMIAVTDHHTVKGVTEIKKVKNPESIVILPGVELTCRIKDVDEVFILPVFDEEFLAAEINKMLLSWKIPEKNFGSGNFIVPVAVKQVLDDVRSTGGIAIASRSDKTPLRKKAIPELINMGVNIFDLVHPQSQTEVFLKYKDLITAPLHFFTFSDSHSSGGAGSRFSDIDLPEPTFKALVDKLNKKS